MSTPVAVSQSATAVTIASENYRRQTLSIFNNSSDVLYIAFANTVTTALFAVKIAAAGYYEMPQPVDGSIVSGIWAQAGAGTALVSQRLTT